jgi:hypothetical protein
MRNLITIPCWIILSIGSTAFLAFDFCMVKLLGKKVVKIQKPYFKVRSIISATK